MSHPLFRACVRLSLYGALSLGTAALAGPKEANKGPPSKDERPAVSSGRAPGGNPGRSSGGSSGSSGGSSGNSGGSSGNSGGSSGNSGGSSGNSGGGWGRGGNPGGGNPGNSGGGNSGGGSPGRSGGGNPGRSGGGNPGNSGGGNPGHSGGGNPGNSGGGNPHSGGGTPGNSGGGWTGHGPGGVGNGGNNNGDNGHHCEGNQGRGKGNCGPVPGGTDNSGGGTIPAGGNGNGGGWGAGGGTQPAGGSTHGSTPVGSGGGNTHDSSPPGSNGSNGSGGWDREYDHDHYDNGYQPNHYVEGGGYHPRPRSSGQGYVDWNSYIPHVDLGGGLGFNAPGGALGLELLIRPNDFLGFGVHGGVGMWGNRISPVVHLYPFGVTNFGLYAEGAFSFNTGGDTTLTVNGVEQPVRMHFTPAVSAAIGYRRPWNTWFWTSVKVGYQANLQFGEKYRSLNGVELNPNTQTSLTFMSPGGLVVGASAGFSFF